MVIHAHYAGQFDRPRKIIAHTWEAALIAALEDGRTLRLLRWMSDDDEFAHDKPVEAAPVTS